MKFLLCIILCFIVSLPVGAISATGVNPAAVNMLRYNQQRAYYGNRNARTTPRYVYSEQQARYYGIRTPNSSYQYNQNYRNYGTQHYYGQ